MLWEYSQSTGVLTFNKVEEATGYSGSGSGKNSPLMEHMVDVGPIPKGDYTIEGPRTSQKTGPYVLPLQPTGHNAHGRTAFQIHGDSIKNPGTASSGCIIMPRKTREKIWNSGVRSLTVIE